MRHYYLLKKKQEKSYVYNWMDAIVAPIYKSPIKTNELQPSLTHDRGLK